MRDLPVCYYFALKSVLTKVADYSRGDGVSPSAAPGPLNSHLV